jgi:hypothetical protein
MRRLRFHHRASLFHQISAVIGRFNLVRDRMRERAFGKIASTALFARPIAEAGTKAVRRRKASWRITLCLNPAKQRSKRHITEYLFARRRKDEGFVLRLFLERLYQCERGSR